MIDLSPAGALSATGADMAKFMIAHLQNGAFGDQRILSEETAKKMHGTPLTIIPNVNRMLLGFYETNRNGHRIISHGGDTQYFHSDLHLFVDDGVGYFISFNCAGKEGAVRPLREAFYAASPTAISRARRSKARSTRRLRRRTPPRSRAATTARAVPKRASSAC